jgi:hypothetical protein
MPYYKEYKDAECCAERRLCLASFMLSATIKPTMLRVVVPNVVATETKLLHLANLNSESNYQCLPDLPWIPSVSLQRRPEIQGSL